MLILYSIPLMPSGMVRTVHPPAHAVSSTTLHGLQRTCPVQQLMIIIELRICVELTPSTEDVPIELIELYVK